MKRSKLNSILLNAVGFISQMNFHLPPFAFWSHKEWAAKDERYKEIKDNMLGWDITDFGYGDYEKIGLLMFTIRNGSPDGGPHSKPYAEKLLISNENQVTPYHFHRQKMEDIINRGGGNLIVKVFNATADEKLDEKSDVTVSKDGFTDTLPAGSTVRLLPGESITVRPGLYHSFWGEEGHGTVLVGEVSKVNDDRTDNRFLHETGRFPDIEEDEEPLYLLYQDYSDIKVGKV